MRKVIIYRVEETDTAIFGCIFSENKLFGTTLELPWKNNEQDISCIPKGEYICELKNSTKYGLIFEVTNVYGRTNIYIGHVGNEVKNILGCILIGTGKHPTRDYLYNSGAAGKAFFEAMKENIAFKLEII